MVISPPRNCARVKVEDQKPSWILQYTIRLARYSEKILMVAKIEAEAKNDDIETVRAEWQIFRRASMSVYASFSRNLYGLL
jgi:hypothetical protein